MPSNARGVASEIEQECTIKSFRAIRYEMCIQVGVACPIKGATAWGMAAGHTDAAVIQESPAAQTGLVNMDFRSSFLLGIAASCN